MNTRLKDSPLLDALNKLALRIEAVESFIVFKFGENALGNGKTQSKIDRTKKSEDYVVETTQKPDTLKRRKSSRLAESESTQKRTRVSQRIKSYKESDNSNSEEEEESESFNNDDYNTLLIPKQEVEDPSYESQNYEDENDDDTNSVNGEEQDSGNKSSDEESAQEDDDSNVPWKSDNYEPPVILDKGVNQHILVYNRYTYTLRTKPKRNSDGSVCLPTISQRQVWRCSMVSSKGEKAIRCNGRIYTRGPEYKVVNVLGEHKHPPRTDKIVKHTVMYSMKKLAETTDQPILDIINNTLREADEKTKLALPKYETIRNFLRRARKAVGKKPVRTTTPCFDHLINKLKKGETTDPKSNKNSEDSTKNISLVSLSLPNQKDCSSTHNRSTEDASQTNNGDVTSLLIPKTEIPSFGDNPDDEDDCDIDAEMDNAEQYTPAEDDIHAPFLQKDYEPPFFLEKGNTKRLLVYEGFTYTLRSRNMTSLDECSGVVIRERKESDKKIWRCSLRLRKTESNNSTNCLATIYTWGPELKVLGFLGQHSHPPRTEEIQKRIYMGKLREIAKTTDTPINEIIENGLKDAPEEIKSILPQSSTLKHYLRAARSNKKPHVKNTIKMYQMIKHLKGADDSQNSSHDHTQKPEDRKSHLNNIALDSKLGEHEVSGGGNFDGNGSGPKLDGDTNAPWMMSDYVPPIVLPSSISSEDGDGIVLGFKGYLYYTDYKCKRSEWAAKEHEKRNWKCSCSNEEGEKCKARMYTWGPEYKVLGFLGEHNHPPREDKIEARLFMEKLKEIARKSEAPLSEIVKDALIDKSDEFKDILPKLESIYSTLRRTRSKCGMQPKRIRSVDSSDKPSTKRVRSKTKAKEFNMCDYF